MNLKKMRESSAQSRCKKVLTNLDSNPQGKRAVEMLLQGVPIIFLTGKAGTGKSTIIKEVLNLRDKETVLLAPTGIAAMNIGGSTIHSFFRFGIGLSSPNDITVKDCPNKALFKSLERLVIDEISMVRADLLDKIDIALQKWRDNSLPFGGVQVLLVGDCLQLPPVITPAESEVYYQMYQSGWFFDSMVMHRAEIKIVELTKTFRQNDSLFIDALDRIRENDNHRDSVALINRSCFRDIDQGFKPDLILCGTNRQADIYNQRNLAALSGEAKTYEGCVKGGIRKESKLPAPYLLRLKVGAQVMILKNIGDAVNGTLGTIKALTDDSVVVIRKDNGVEVKVEREKWEKLGYKSEQGAIISKVEGTYEQFPLQLGWSVTVHKSQGLTLDNVEIDIGGNAFAAGQGYVALSRCKTLKGIKLSKPLSMGDVRADKAILEFYALLRENAVSEST